MIEGGLSFTSLHWRALRDRRLVAAPWEWVGSTVAVIGWTVEARPPPIGRSPGLRGASLRYNPALMPDAPLHVVFGAGQIGSKLADLLASRRLRVRVVRRSKKPLPNGIEVVSGDAQNPVFAASVTEGAAVIYHCMNPSIYRALAWEKEFPRFGEALIHAAVQNRARLVCLDNLYGYGEYDGRRAEATALRAQGRKGKVRIGWAARLDRGAREQGLRFVLLRAGDFFGPGADQSVVSEPVLKRIQAGKAAWAIGDPTAPHAFSFAPDVATPLESALDETAAAYRIKRETAPRLR